MDVEGVERDPAMGTQASESLAHEWQSVLGKIDKHRTWVLDLEVPKARRIGRNGHGHVETEPALARLWRSPHQAHGTTRPQASHEPALFFNDKREFRSSDNRKLIHLHAFDPIVRGCLHTVSRSRAATTSLLETTVSPASSAQSNAVRARRSVARKFPRATSKIPSVALASKGKFTEPAKATR